MAAEFTWLNVHAICADFTGKLELPDHVSTINRVAFFPGSTIGNFSPSQAVSVLEEIRAMVGGEGGLLIGVDLRKDTNVLDAAYNDQAGYTERFNKNLLVRINRELAADFNVTEFQHYAFYNEKEHRIEMHLVSQEDQRVLIGDKVFLFKKEQSILTEYSHKYSVESFHQIASQAGFENVKTWVDKDQLFSVHYLVSN